MLNVQHKDATLEGFVRVALEIADRKHKQLEVIDKALGVNDEKTAVMCMKRFFNKAPCTGNTAFCSECPVEMGEYGSEKRC